MEIAGGFSSPSWILYAQKDKILSMLEQKARIYHVFLGKRRTTVSLDPAIAFFLELKLGEKPGTPGAKKTVRQWLQERLDKENDPGRLRVSQWLKRDTLLALVDPKLVKRYWEWVDGGMSDNG
jgi:hypothetical protein